MSSRLTHAWKTFALATRLAEYRYVIEHIARKDNVWADMVSRWARLPPSIPLRRVRTRHEGHQDQYTLRLLDDDNFVWPTLRELTRAKSQHATVEDRRSLTENDDCVHLRDGKIWAPIGAADILRRLSIIAHCGPQGHRGHDAMMTHLGRLVTIGVLRKRIDSFLSRTLHTLPAC